MRKIHFWFQLIKWMTIYWLARWISPLHVGKLLLKVLWPTGRAMAFI